MNTQTPQARHRQLRDVAIFVASLDDAMAQRLLGSMPAKDAAAVLAEVDELENIDPDEQREVVEKFRRSMAPKPAPKVEGVELDASLLAKIEERDSEGIYSVPQSPQQTLEALNDAEASAIVEMLSAEHPQTIAIVLSRIEVTKAAELMGMLSVSLQAEVLGRMGNLDTADEQTVQVIESQLANWIEQQRKLKHRQAAGMELVQRILEHTPEAQRETVLAHMGRNTPAVSKLVPPKSTRTKTSKRQVKTVSAVHAKRRDFSLRVETASEQPPRPPQASVPSSIPAIEHSADPLTELEQTDDVTLMAALSRTDRQVGALALAGASDVLMKRVLRGLPRRQANTMRRQLRTIGPTKLSDMLAAQQQLLQSVRQLAPR
ncbi:MAG: hypothetical protein GXP26_13680 [Planctomycetes bacterium]|nr:hypothetical protein [Planctomycetota bacterium]